MSAGPVCAEENAERRAGGSPACGVGVPSGVDTALAWHLDVLLGTCPWAVAACVGSSGTGQLGDGAARGRGIRLPCAAWEPPVPSGKAIKASIVSAEEGALQVRRFCVWCGRLSACLPPASPRG